MKNTAFFVILFATLLPGISWAQEIEDAGTASSPATELEAEAPDEEDTEAEAEAGADPVELEDPLSEVDAAEQAEVQATMERFQPSEKISEDRSVAFPNDI